MKRFLTLFLLAALPFAVEAAECPVDYAKVDEVVAAAPTCRAALDLLNRCAVGATGDVIPAGTVRERCERDFLPRLSRAASARYAREQDACERKYAREEGTMYRSAEAFCHAGLAARYSARALRRK